ncbi:hypothetical protein [Magnetovibrio blakemorei]|uniref:Uncharacterized protein n=1 Tax=Magnetovibrio blakemorei TaxID=28181 RepID=A0A1E5QB57_9PROT|nr:hypothetical protein [Magnetovibrio blakemorei]OEJ69266.1 hypothetical protein BEN30_04075 [Magnetovibrio blakemorei]
MLNAILWGYIKDGIHFNFDPSPPEWGEVEGNKQIGLRLICSPIVVSFFKAHTKLCFAIMKKNGNIHI